jgi:hypothetical protein
VIQRDGPDQVIKCLAEGRFYQLPSVAGDRHRDVAVILFRAWRSGKIRGDAFRSALSWVWVNTMAPVQTGSNPGLDSSGWIQMFDSVGYVARSGLRVLADNQPAVALYPFPRELLERPTGSLVAWRGSVLSRERGMSWTSYESCAESFAKDAAEHEDAAVFRTIIPGSGVLAAFSDGREQEIVVNPYALPADTEVVKRLPRVTPRGQNHNVGGDGRR